MAPTDPISDSGDSPYDSHHSGMHGGASEINGASEGGAGGNGVSSNGGGMLSRLGAHLPSTSTLNWNYGPPPRPEILSAKPNPVELLHAVRRRWTLALGLGLLVSGLVCGLVWYLVPVRYEAYATVKVSNERPSVFDQQHITRPDDFKIFKATQQQLVTSNLVMNAVLRDRSINQLSTFRELSEDPVIWLQDQLMVEYPGDTEIMRISIRTEKLDDSVKIVDKVVEVYLKEIVDNERRKRMESEDQLRRQADKLSADFALKSKHLADLEKQYSTSGSEEAQMRKQLAIEELRQLIIQRNQYQAELSNNDMVTLLMKTKAQTMDTSPPEVLIDIELEKDPEVAQLRQQLALHQQHLSAVRSSATGPHATPHVEQIHRQILQLEDQIEEIKHQRMPRLLELFRLNASGPDTRYPLTLEQLAEQRKHLEARVVAATQEVEAKKKEVAEMQTFSAQVASQTEELAILREHKNLVALEMSRVETERLAPERIFRLENAVPFGQGDAIRKYMAVIFSGLLSFCSVVLAVAVLEFQARKINSVQEVNDGLGVRVVGELPNVRGRAFRRLGGGKGQNVLKALMAERIDGTRTALIHTTAIDPPRVVMVTSADPHEGKTTTSTQLAASLARSGRRTLLIDADIRNPGAHRVFEISQDPGLCELLRGEADRDAVVHPTRTANLWLMPAGRCDLRSVQALSGAYLGSTIAALSVQFDYVVIDAGPVLKVADPLLVGQHVDAVIVSVLKDVSRVPRVYEAIERLRSVGITILGSVVNGVKDDVARHGVELLMAETPQQEQPAEAGAT